jgi:pre-mRNA-splicing helicase BRR2
VQKIETIFDLLEMTDTDRDRLLQLNETQMADVARYANRYPNIELNYDIANKDNIRT